MPQLSPNIVSTRLTGFIAGALLTAVFSTASVAQNTENTGSAESMKRQQAQPLSLKIQKDYNLRTPRRGEAMESVERRFGAPESVRGPVGNRPSRAGSTRSLTSSLRVTGLSIPSLSLTRTAEPAILALFTLAASGVMRIGTTIPTCRRVGTAGRCPYGLAPYRLGLGFQHGTGRTRLSGDRTGCSGG